MAREPDSATQPVIVLVHSPLVGPLTWAPVSRELRRHGVGTLLPVLDDHGNDAMPFWVQHATAVAQRLEMLPPDGGVILVGHSGAGPLLPAIGAFSPHPVAGYLFVDAGLPHPGRSPLDEIEAGMPEFGRELRHELEAGGPFPQWADEDLRDLIPDAVLRQGVLAELQPRNLTFFEEPLPHVDGWPDVPCAYIRLSEGYDRAAQEAQRRGWSYREFEAGHFHMLVDAPGVAGAILQVAPLVAPQERRLSDRLE
jgi:pimeloyl-ACP methyl ester carboxylesterase